jgi:5'-methylthioadenosine phosphorylase
MKESIHPLDLVIPEQFFDATAGACRRSSATASWPTWAWPIRCARRWPTRSRRPPAAAPPRAARRHLHLHRGPQFSTKAESRVYRQWGVDVIGMTNMPEAKLAREAELCYATLALVTDYDVWHDSHEAVTVEAVIRNLLRNVATAKEVLRRVIPRSPDRGHAAAPSCCATR